MASFNVLGDRDTNMQFKPAPSPEKAKSSKLEEARNNLHSRLQDDQSVNLCIVRAQFLMHVSEARSTCRPRTRSSRLRRRSSPPSATSTS